MRQPLHAPLVKCLRAPGSTACEPCIERELPCTFPSQTAAAAGPANRRTSCDRCRLKRSKCERQAGDTTSCVACSTNGAVCSHGATPTVAPMTATGDTTVQQEGVQDEAAMVAAAEAPPQAGPSCGDTQISLVIDTTPAACTDSGLGSASVGLTSPSRSYWHIVLSPSPDI
ncbi:hypothetical protein BD414DRAFT_476181 [Trametes punicea]|nr:hypothetical protein BD414DRAFT_476181 [Trametes punicea]